MTDTPAQEILRLRNTMRDLVALSTLPAIWSGHAPEGIAKSLAEILVSTLSLDLIYVRVRDQSSDIEVVRAKGLHPDDAQVRAVAEALDPWLAGGAHDPPACVANPLTDGVLHVAVARFGYAGNEGAVAACSRRPDFPTESERLLLSVGTNQTAMVHQRKKAQRALAEERERLRITLSSIGDAVISTDADGRVIFLNGVAESLTGWSQAEAAGKFLPDVFQILNQHTRRPAENPVLRALREGRIVGLANHTVLIAKDGSERVIEDSAAPMLSESGATVGAVLVFRDVTERKRAEEDQVRLAAIVESSDDVIISKSLDGIIQTWNSAAERVFGYTAGEAIGRSITLIIPPELLEEERGILGKLRRGEQIEHFETVRVAKDGRRLHISLTVSPVRNAAGHVIGASKVARDITSRKLSEENFARLTAESERQRRMYETTLSNTADFNYVFDLEGRFTFVNKALLNLWQKELADVIGKTPLELRYSKEFARRLLNQIQEVITTKRPLRDETPYSGTVGARAYEYIFVPVFGADGSVEAVAGSTRDITERKAMENALREADHKKDDFIALLAHELRNPLAPLRNGLQVIRLAKGNEDAAGQAQAMMDRQLSHMVRLVDDLLDVSRINRSKMELRRARVALVDVVNAAVETARPAIDAEQHVLTISLPKKSVILDADLTRLAQVFSNLLTNSAKYTERGGRIWLTAERVEGEVAVSVQDTGIGIPIESLGNIFNMFNQVDRSVERSTGGLGIGLALVKGLVEMHGGTVKAESGGQGMGSKFTVTLPVLADQTGFAAGTRPDEERTGSGPRRRILVVDDNRDGADSLAMMLRLMKNEVRTARDGLEAVEQAEAFRPEIVLMDVGLPKMNGLDATRRIREQAWGKDMTIIALTGWGQDRDREQSHEAGCDGHLVKPVNLPDLEKMLGELRSNRPEIR